MDGKPTILVVEDSAPVRTLIVQMLEDAGYPVLTARGADTALRWFDERGCEIRLLVTDLMLPGVSGVDLGAQARERCPDLKVLYISGYRLREHPGMDFIEKPFEPETLLQKVRGMLEA